MHESARHSRRLRVYDLLEAAQDIGHEGVPAQLSEIRDQARHDADADLQQLAATGLVFYDLLHGHDHEATALECDRLVEDAEALELPGLLSMALSMRAMHAISVDNEALLADAGRAVALADLDEGEPVDRGFAWTTLGGAYTSLDLWELADEVNDRAADLAPECPDPYRQLAAVNSNRFHIRIAWGAALLEHGDVEAAMARLTAAQEAADTALLTVGVPLLWQHAAVAARDLLRFVRRAYGSAENGDVADDLERIHQHRLVLHEYDEADVRPYFDPFLALGLHLLGRSQEARALLAPATSGTAHTPADTFAAWVLAQVLSPAELSEDARAHRAYGALVHDLHWTARAGVLAAARARIAESALTSAHASLSREVGRDPLTGLDNRRRFDRWLSHDEDEGRDASVADPGAARPTALLLIDVDEFKQVNDTFGHDTGDEVLRQIAEIITGGIRDQDVALRLGGDEFAVILAGQPGQEHSGDVLEQAAAGRARSLAGTVVEAPWQDLAAELAVSVSIGWAVGAVGRDETGSARDLYRAADADLYVHKRARNFSHFEDRSAR
ncbi:GGDEF domain-containing protein [Nocardioides mangrovicus]|uniref:GGDEF domain-containing protein n=1 Tax=Nocardioides mangrovicus TaxID=2478913 RepID=A0A3L8NYW3_9ACTN|nr:GGDEF domain-containing protein [Nocardioides mangrovicus]RLV47549.1 GGDEF domain-containing protein [Nocardioides mangrovicus]